MAKWLFVVILIYFFITILFFGYSQVDEKRGLYTFYWSGLNALFNKQDFGIIKNKRLDTAFDGLDGPYLVDSIIYSINDKGRFSKSKTIADKEIEVATGKEYLTKFKVRLKSGDSAEKSVYPNQKKLLAISDIEGNFTGFFSFLLSNRVIDPGANWIYGNGHLVLNGDFVDRGADVTQVLWLIYRLEQQAEAKGGKVHYILGNHEVMMLQGNASYANFKYIQAAKQISGKENWDEAIRTLYSERSELGRWLRKKNIIERIGKTLFVHAGMNIKHVNAGIDIETLNKIARENYGRPYDKNFKSFKHELTLSSIYSPYWDRSLAMDFKNKALYFLNNIKIKKTSEDELQKILRYYSATRMVIGHSVVDDVKIDYGDKIIKMDVKHGLVLNSGETKGVLFENGLVYKVDDALNKISLNNHR